MEIKGKSLNSVWVLLRGDHGATHWGFGGRGGWKDLFYPRRGCTFSVASRSSFSTFRNQAAREMSGDAVPQLLVPALLKLECKKKYKKRDVSSISQKKSHFHENVRLFPGTDCLACRTRLCSLLLPLSRSCSTNPRNTRSRHLWGKN